MRLTQEEIPHCESRRENRASDLNQWSGRHTTAETSLTLTKSAKSLFLRGKKRMCKRISLKHESTRTHAVSLQRETVQGGAQFDRFCFCLLLVVVFACCSSCTSDSRLGLRGFTFPVPGAGAGLIASHAQDPARTAPHNRRAGCGSSFLEYKPVPTSPPPLPLAQGSRRQPALSAHSCR